MKKIILGDIPEGVNDFSEYIFAGEWCFLNRVDLFNSCECFILNRKTFSPQFEEMDVPRFLSFCFQQLMDFRQEKEKRWSISIKIYL
ncbi:MAG: hypothetical protein LBB25_00830 [Holosporaceae bacterium]|jgi:hypothetical protein|nr:hypothetical protein [Holosporaceae bacterium]